MEETSSGDWKDSVKNKFKGIQRCVFLCNNCQDVKRKPSDAKSQNPKEEMIESLLWGGSPHPKEETTKKTQQQRKNSQ